MHVYSLRPTLLGPVGALLDTGLYASHECRFRVSRKEFPSLLIGSWLWLITTVVADTLYWHWKYYITLFSQSIRIALLKDSAPGPVAGTLPRSVPEPVTWRSGG